MYLLGSHVGMSGKDMMLGSVKTALSYGANTFMLYTGAPQNTRRKKIEELNIPAARELMKENGIETFVVHAPYIINLANTVKPETFQIATDFLAVELERTEAMGSETLVLHPGSHVGAGEEAGIAQIIKGLDMVMKQDMKVKIALETMAGKGSEIGRSFEELKAIYDGVRYPENLRVCFDTCHVNDAGYDIVNHYEEVMEEFDRVLGLDQIAVFILMTAKIRLERTKTAMKMWDLARSDLILCTVLSRTRDLPMCRKYWKHRGSNRKMIRKIRFRHTKKKLRCCRVE